MPPLKGVTPHGVGRCPFQGRHKAETGYVVSEGFVSRKIPLLKPADTARRVPTLHEAFFSGQCSV